MITGQFTGQTLLNYQWHTHLQQWMSEKYPEHMKRTFVSKMTSGVILNHLILSNVVFITTKSSASASESLINCLKPYINVTQIGTQTHGRYTASVTLFDSPDFFPSHINNNHKWAIQPIILKISNIRGDSDFVNGLTPDIFKAEDYFNMGILGETNEPLLQESLNYISTQTFNRSIQSTSFREIYYMPEPLFDEMYINVNDIKLAL
jgi:C-terminal processing protease CtpA/Prc